MNWEECLKENVKEVRKDAERAKSLFKMAAKREEFITKSESDKEDYPSIIVEGYYEIIKELITGLMRLQGYKSNNHLCNILFLNHFYPDKFSRSHTTTIDILRKTRNKINYEGLIVKSEFLERYQDPINQIIQKLKNILDKELLK